MKFIVFDIETNRSGYSNRCVLELYAAYFNIF